MYFDQLLQLSFHSTKWAFVVLTQSRCNAVTYDLFAEVDVILESLTITSGYDVIVREFDNAFDIEFDFEHHEGRPITAADKLTVNIVATNESDITSVSSETNLLDLQSYVVAGPPIEPGTRV